MYDRSRLNRLIALGLSSCALTWAFTAAAQARPDVPQGTGDTAAPAFKAVAGDTNKAPGATAAPAFTPAAGDTAKSPDPRQVERVLNGIARGKAPVAAPAGSANDDTGTIALIVAIAAMLVALGAVTLIVTRAPRPVLRA
jgi:hypothetical protein